MTPQKGYILKPISELPQESGEYWLIDFEGYSFTAFFDKTEGVFQHEYFKEVGARNWLQPFEGIVLTADHLEEERRKAFEAARESELPFTEEYVLLYPEKYKNYEDYINSIK